MDGVRVISSVAVLLFVLLASFSAAREERAAKRTWKPLTTETLQTYNYLAVVEYKDAGNSKYCSASITSTSTVVTYCIGKPEVAYAGLAASGLPSTSKQQSEVDKVVDSDLKDLKICILKKNWTMNTDVGVVTLPPKAESVAVGSNCTVLGFDSTTSGAEKPHKLDVKIATITECNIQASDGLVCSAVADATKEKLGASDMGGPLVCGTEQRGISKEFKAKPNPNPDSLKDCNSYIDIAPLRDWIDGQIKAADPEASGGTGGTGGNGTASSGYSIHSHLNKYSNWKVLWFLVPIIVTFLQY